MVYAEQGFGDSIQFARFLPLVVAQGGTVIFECPSPLVGLMQQIQEVMVLARGDAIPGFDCYAPLMSLPLHLGITPENLPSPPYLHPNAELLEKWRDRLASVEGIKIGLCWQGASSNSENARRSFPLALCKELLQLPGTTFINLLKGDGETDIKAHEFSDRIINFMPKIENFTDTAALMANLDLIITCDTVIAHLAGALGCPVWVLLRFAADWRWSTGETTPWYPETRLFRQPEPSEWETVLREATATLRSDLSGH